VRALAALIAAVPVAGAALQCLFVWFLLNFCMDYCDGTPMETDTGASVFLVGVTAAALVSAGVYWFFVATRKAHAAARWLGVHAAIALGLLVYWLGESAHSDGQLLAIWLGVELAAGLALLLSREDARRRVRPA
jgi:hypothetical protein